MNYQTDLRALAMVALASDRLLNVRPVDVLALLDAAARAERAITLVWEHANGLADLEWLNRRDAFLAEVDRAE